MSDKILGYYRNGDPIYETPRGTVATRATILCCVCEAIIKTDSGPSYGAVCPEHKRELVDVEQELQNP